MVLWWQGQAKFDVKCSPFPAFVPFLKYYLHDIILWCPRKFILSSEFYVSVFYKLVNLDPGKRVSVSMSEDHNTQMRSSDH